MRILILSSKLPYPPRDGGALATLNLATGLAKSGMHVTMLAINTKKHYFDPDKIPDDLKLIIEFKTVYKDTTIRFFSALKNLLFSTIPYIAERYYFLGYKLELERILQQSNFHIVQMEGPYFANYIKTIKQNSNAKIILRAHNIEHKIWQQRNNNESRLLKKLYLQNMASRVRKLELFMLQNADLVASISNADDAFFRSISPGLKSVTIPAGIDTSKYTITSSFIENSIFFLGSLDWMPNQEGLLWFIREAFPVILEKNSDIIFHIAGRNAPEEFITEIEHPNIIYHGEVENAISFMNKYKIMAVPLLTGSGIRIKIIEGMALGKCIVTTSLGAEGISSGEENGLLIANHAKQFAEKLTEVLEDKSKAESISIAARKFILEKFDTFVIASKLSDLYKTIT